MTMHHVLRAKKYYFNLIDKGIKPLEVRVGYPQIKKIKEGDTITFENYGKNLFDVVHIFKYNSFADMLEHENPELIIPGKTKDQVLQMLYEIYPGDKEKLGVYVLELKKHIDFNESVKIISASHVAKNNRKSFGSLISKAYAVTDYICDDYPNHFNWYWEKTVPAVLKGTREVLVCSIDKNIAGVAFLKKEDGEAKICTLLVLEEYRGKGVASKLMEKSFEFLETTKPLISIADYKLEMFSGVIAKYNWQLTQTLPKGYYNNSSEELVYNGIIK